MISEDWEYFTPDPEIEEALAEGNSLPLRFRDLLNRRSDEKPGYSIIKRKKHRQHDPGNLFSVPRCFREMLETMLDNIPEHKREAYLRDRLLRAMKLLPPQDLHCLMANLLGIRSLQKRILFNEHYLRKSLARFLDLILTEACKPRCLCGCGQPITITESLYKQAMRTNKLTSQVSEKCLKRMNQ